MNKEKEEKIKEEVFVKKVFDFLVKDFSYEYIGDKSSLSGIEQYIYRKNDYVLIIKYYRFFLRDEEELDILICKLGNMHLSDARIDRKIKDGISFTVNDILEIRAPKEIIKITDFKYAKFELYLKQYAEALKKYCSDILLGDFNLFSELAKKEEERYKNLTA